MKPAHKIIMLIISIFVIASLAVFGWFWGAGQFRHIVEGKILDFAANDKTITCNNMEIRGFPFRIGLFCSNTAFDDNARRLGFMAGELRTAAQIYRPGHIISELDGPMIITTREDQIEANWQNFRASLLIDLVNLSRTSIEITDAKIKFNAPSLPALKEIIAKNIQLHAKQNNADLDLAANSVDIQIKNKSENLVIPIVKTAFVATILNRADSLQHNMNKQTFSLRGSDIKLHELLIRLADNAHISLSGFITISNQGLLNGDLALSLRNMTQLQSVIQNINPRFADIFSNLTVILSTLDTINTQDDIKINLVLKNGKIRAGLFPLGTIPAIR